MNEDRRKILEMLANGKITTDEADRLLSALDKGSTATPSGVESGVKPPPKYLRVIVEQDSEKEGKNHVNVRVPMQLLRAGVRLAGLMPRPALDHANQALHDQGIPIDLSQIKPENLEELVDHLSDMTVDVDQQEAKVRVFCE